MKIAIGSDHGGVNHKEYIEEYLTKNGHEFKDFGTSSGESVDYPDIAEAVAVAVRDEAFDCGILICGTGIGMSIAANKVRGIRAAHVTDTYSAKMAKQHNDAHIICLGERITGPDLAIDIVDSFLAQEHLGDRHARRVEKIMAIEKSQK
ncbi:MAG: ribose 5-phosphate isomerase B [Clostridia bacterium]|nr:ribose 5-phosphate isomerase B [Clostridia bacterium]